MLSLLCLRWLPQATPGRPQTRPPEQQLLGHHERTSLEKFVLCLGVSRESLHLKECTQSKNRLPQTRQTVLTLAIAT